MQPLVSVKREGNTELLDEWWNTRYFATAPIAAATTINRTEHTGSNPSLCSFAKSDIIATITAYVHHFKLVSQ